MQVDNMMRTALVAFAAALLAVALALQFAVADLPS